MRYLAVMDWVDLWTRTSTREASSSWERPRSLVGVTQTAQRLQILASQVVWASPHEPDCNRCWSDFDAYAVNTVPRSPTGRTQPSECLVHNGPSNGQIPLLSKPLSASTLSASCVHSTDATLFLSQTVEHRTTRSDTKKHRTMSRLRPTRSPPRQRKRHAYHCDTYKYRLGRYS
jgi:hypothetical protein